MRQITAHSGTELTVDSAWDTTPDSTSTYEVFNLSQPGLVVEAGMATSATSTTLDRPRARTSASLVGKFVRIIEGSGAGEVREITAHTGSELTIDSAWDTTPDSTSLYEVYDTEGYSIEVTRYDGLKIPIVADAGRR